MNTNNNASDNALEHDARLTAYALHELSALDQAELKESLAADPSAAQAVEETKRLAASLREACAAPAEPPQAALREAVVARLDELEAGTAKVELAKPAEKAWRRTRILAIVAAAACLIVVAYPIVNAVRERNSIRAVSNIDDAFFNADRLSKVEMDREKMSDDVDEFRLDDITPSDIQTTSTDPTSQPMTLETPTEVTDVTLSTNADAAPVAVELSDFGERTAPRNDLAKQIGAIHGSGLEGRSATVRAGLVATNGGSPARRDGRGATTDYFAVSPPVVRDPGKNVRGHHFELDTIDRLRYTGGSEQYELPPENAFLPVDKTTALSTFSIDVDTASYANIRRFLSQNQLPPPAAVRIEEMLNYFRYTYPQPQGEDPFSVNMELADCPWQPGHDLLRIGLKGKDVVAKERKAGNLVFLIDVSGSMQPENKLPLLKQALKMLVGELTENDTVTICTYAGDAGLKLAATNGTQQNELRTAIDSLSAGGSTHGSAGIELAYEQAAKSFIKGGTNRVILATDGDLNVGITDDGALVDLIKTKAAGGVFLTVLGVGEGNLKDAKMEKLADNGNGVYAYLDTLREARKVLVEQLAGSLETIAKDVKLQIEFNPAVVKAYRLIGYENRVLATRDFHDDKKDAGEIGAGHTVTALYELVPTRAKAVAKPEVRAEGGEPLKYQKSPEVKPAAPEALTPAADSGEALTLKLRFKQPDSDTSKLREFPLKSEGGRFNRASADFQFAAAVASFGMLLRGSEHRGDATFSAVEEIAAGSIGPDASGYRAEFLDLVWKAKTLGR